MAEREKVMSWLEGLTYDDWRRYHSDSEVRTIAKAALELLKEQEPVSVAGPDNYEEYWDREAICPDCGTHWMSYDKNGKRITKYCPGCGRLVKWQ